MANESVSGANSGPIDDELVELLDAWPILPRQKRQRILSIVRGCPPDKQCPACGDWPTRVRTSYEGGAGLYQVQTVDCPHCQHEFLRHVPREEIAPRRRPKRNL